MEARADRGAQEMIDAVFESVARHRWAPEAEDDYTLIVSQAV